MLPDLHPPDTSHNCCKMGKSFNSTRSKGSTMIRNFCHNKCTHPIKLRKFESLLYIGLNCMLLELNSTKTLNVFVEHMDFLHLHIIILFECPYFKSMVLKYRNNHLQCIFQDAIFLLSFVKLVLYSPVSLFL